MSAIVKANANLTAGGLAVLRREYSTTDDGILNYLVDYCCLSQFANNHIGKFRTRSTPPTAIPASMSLLRLAGLPTLYDLTTTSQNGLTYFNARYSVASLDASETIITESSEQRNFSAVVPGSVRTAGNFGSTITVTGEANVSFDYISITVRAESKDRRILPLVKGRVGPIFNQSISQISGVSPLLLGRWRQTTIDTESKTYSSRGVYTYTKSSSGIYEAA